MSAQITLSREQVAQLQAFCETNKLTEFFVAKDQGAYVGAAMGGDNNCIFYFKGCNPKTDEDWYETCHAKFGGDDFGEHLPVVWLNQFMRSAKNYQKLTLKVTARDIKAEMSV